MVFAFKGVTNDKGCFFPHGKGVGDGWNWFFER